MDPLVHSIRLSQISISPALAMVPMRRAIIEKFAASPKPELKKIAAEIQAEHHAQLSSLDEDGILDAIKCYREGRLWIACDGRHRIEWAYGKKLIRVPVTEVSKEVGMRLIESSVIGRIHWTKGQRAWLGVMQHPEVCEATKGTRTDSIGSFNNAPALASRLGVSADVVNQAVSLYRLFFAPGFKAGSPEAIEAAARKAKYEHLIWGGAGLGGIIAGIAGGDATTDKPKAATGFHHLDQPLASLTRLGKVWLSWDAEERAKAQALIVARVRGGEGAEVRAIAGAGHACLATRERFGRGRFRNDKTRDVYEMHPPCRKISAQRASRSQNASAFRDRAVLQRQPVSHRKMSNSVRRHQNQLSKHTMTIETANLREPRR